MMFDRFTYRDDILGGEKLLGGEIMIYTGVFDKSRCTLVLPTPYLLAFFNFLPRPF